MHQKIGQTTVLVNDYDEAIEFFVQTLGFELIQDTPDTSPHIPEHGKRWIIVAPPGSQTGILLSRATTPKQKLCVGKQAVERVFLYLFTDDFWRDYKRFRERGVEFVRGDPRVEPYGTVAVFLDVSGNMWDLIQQNENG